MICFYLSTRKFRFWYIDITFSFIICWNIKAWIKRPIWKSSKKGKKKQDINLDEEWQDITCNISSPHGHAFQKGQYPGLLKFEVMNSKVNDWCENLVIIARKSLDIDWLVRRRNNLEYKLLCLAFFGNIPYLYVFCWLSPRKKAPFPLKRSNFQDLFCS